jgi:hypothetical protein
VDRESKASRVFKGFLANRAGTVTTAKTLLSQVLRALLVRLAPKVSRDFLANRVGMDRMARTRGSQVLLALRVLLALER